ncbi:MAG: phosphoesterase PA-phosphatase, partial [Segetibacter sp.]
MKTFLFNCLAVLLLTACHSKNDYKAIFKNPDLYSKTVFELNNVVMGNNFSPIVASRNYLYANVAAYEIIAAGHPDQYNSLSNQLRELSSVPKPDPSKKINFEFASLLSFCTLGEAVTFPEGSMTEYVDSIKKLATDHGMPSDEYENSIAYADTVSKVIMAWSKTDNYAKTRSAEKYSIKDEDGRWVPTPPSYASAMEPHWSTIRPLVMDSVNQFVVPAPFHFDLKNKNSDYSKQVMAVKQAVENLT